MYLEAKTNFLKRLFSGKMKKTAPDKFLGQKFVPKKRRR